MVRLIQILSVSLLLTLASAVGAQTPLACGIVDIDGPAEVDPGTPLVLKAQITGMIHTTKPEFKWKVSVGTITTGQGTEEISVDTVGLGGLEVMVTVELSGAPLGCKGSASKTMQVKPATLTCGLPFDRYGDLKFSDEKARLDNFSIQLLNEPLSTGMILMSAGRETFENETTERLARAKSYLVDVRETDPSRIVTIDCGFSQDLSIQLYIVPVGVTAPVCSNTGEAPFEVKFTKPRPSPRRDRVRLDSRLRVNCRQPRVKSSLECLNNRSIKLSLHPAAIVRSSQRREAQASLAENKRGWGQAKIP